MVLPDTGRVSFDSFLLDPGRRLLLRDGTDIHLPPKAFETLLLLVTHRDRVVTKDELLTTVWPDVVVEENNLSQHISQLRKALGPRADGGAYIETVRGVGFRFGRAVPVLPVEQGAPASAFETAPAPVAPPAARWSPGLALTAGAVVIMTAAALFVEARRSTVAPEVAAAPVAVIAVAELEGPNRAFADEMGASVAERLAAVDPRLSSVQHPVRAGVREEGALSRARAVKAPWVLEVRLVRRAGEVLTRAHLIDTRDGTPVWIDESTVASTEVRRAGSRLADRIAAAWQAGGPPAPTTLDAGTSYAKGRYLWNRRSAVSVAQSIAYFERAIADDPSSASARAGLASALAFDSQHWRRADALVDEALAMAGDLAEGHAVRGFIRMFWQWRWVEAGESFRAALRADPANATAHQWYALWLAAHGRSIEARAEMRRAVELDPFSPAIRTDLGQLHYMGEEWDRARQHCQAALDLDPAFVPARTCLFQVAAESGDGQAVLETYAALSTLTEGHPLLNPDMTPRLTDRYASEGLTGVWQALRERAEGIDDQYARAEYAARAGDEATALDALARALDRRSFDLTFLRMAPAFSSLRDRQEYYDVVAAMGLGAEGDRPGRRTLELPR